MTDACPAWQGDLAMMAIDRIEPERVVAVRAHLDGCEACRAALRDLRATARALPPTAGNSWRDSAERKPQGPPASIVDAVLHQVRREKATARRRRALMALATVAAGTVLFLTGLRAGQGALEPASDDVTRQIALTTVAQDADQAKVSATLTARPWGTKVTVTAAGLPPGKEVSVWLVDTAGQRVPCGTFTQPRGRTATVDLASSLSYADAATVGLSASNGNVLARGQQS